MYGIEIFQLLKYMLPKSECCYFVFEPFNLNDQHQIMLGEGGYGYGVCG